MVTLPHCIRDSMDYSELHTFSRKFTGSSNLFILKNLTTRNYSFEQANCDSNPAGLPERSLEEAEWREGSTKKFNG